MLSSSFCLGDQYPIPFLELTFQFTQVSEAMYLDFGFSVFFCVWFVWHYNLHFDSHCCQWHFVLFYGWVVFDAVIFCYILSINYWLTPKFFSIILLLWIVLQLIELHIFFCIVILSFLNVYLGVPSLNHIVVLFLGLFLLWINLFFKKKSCICYVWHEAARYPLTLSALFLRTWFRWTWFWLVISSPSICPS